MSSKVGPNPIVLRANTSIGNISAEADDEFLFECFVDHPALKMMEDLASSKLFISGRTGSGKTAILRMIEQRNENVSSIDLHELALGYVANSTIIQFLDALDIDLDIFFQALWKHILCIEFIRMRFGVKNSDQSKGIFVRISDFFRTDERKKSALNYLRDWEGKFWITMDENIKEITQKLEESVDAELSIEIEKFKSSAGYARSLSKEKKSALVARAKKIVNSDLLHELAKVLDLIAEFEVRGTHAQSYYILIDKLDEKWVDDSVRYQLVRALIECLKSFRRIRTLKIVVALRSDVLERVIQENSHSGFQREKYDDYILRLRWDKNQLKEIVEKRIEYIFKKQYSSEKITFEDIFDTKVGALNSFEYMIERTQLRPRDIISFINVCLSQSEGEKYVTQKAIRKAESEYSRVRLQALTEEWESAFPTLKVAFQVISRQGRDFKSSKILSKEFIEEFIINAGDIFNETHDPLCQIISNFMNTNADINYDQISRLLVSELYRVGAIGLKTSPSESYQHSHINVPIILPELISSDVKISIHPMLHRALNIP